MPGLLLDTAATASSTSLASPSLTDLNLVTASPSASGAYDNLDGSNLLVQSDGASTQVGSFSEASDLHTLTLLSSTASGKRAAKSQVASASSSSPANSLHSYSHAGAGAGLSKMTLLVGSAFVCTFLAAL